MRLSRVINNSTALFALDLLSKAVPLVVFPFLVRVLGPQTYGKLGFATAVAGFFGLLASPGFSAYAQREVAKVPAEVGSVVRDVTGARISFAAGSYILLLMYTIALAPHDPTMRVLIVLCGSVFLVNSLDAQWVFAARSRMWMVATRGVLAQVIYGGIILGFIRHQGDAWIVPLANVSSAAVAVGMIWFAARREYGIPWPRVSPRSWSKFLMVCLTMGLASMMSMIYDQIDTVMLSYLRSAKEVGLYVASYRLMTVALSFVPILGQVFYPLLCETVEGSAEQQKRYLRWFGQASMGLALPIATGGFVLAGRLTKFVLGPQYAGGEVLFRWLMLTILTGSLASYWGSQLIPSGRERRYLIAVIAGALVNVILNVLLIPRYGAVAAALTTALAQGTVAALNYYFVRDLPRPALRGPIAIAAIATVFMGGLIFWLQRFASIHVLLMVLIGTAAYSFLYFLLWRMRNQIVTRPRTTES